MGPIVRAAIAPGIVCTVAQIALGAVMMPPPSLTPIHAVYSAEDVNADGSVVVGRESIIGEAMRWTASGGVQRLGKLSGGLNSYGMAVNGDGSVVTGYGDATGTSAAAMRWTDSGGMVALGQLPAGSNLTFGRGISRDGNVVVGQSGVNAGSRAFRWTSAGGMIDLGDLPGGIWQSSAAAANADGSVVVGQAHGVNGASVFRWTQASGMVEMPNLVADGFTPRSALSVTPDGSTIVGFGQRGGNDEGFIWTAATGYVGLGDLPGGAVTSIASDVSDDGTTVVGRTNSGPQQAFVWDAHNGMRSLEAVLNSVGVDTSQWLLHTATAISGDGTTVVGVGLRNGASTAFVAVIPEPACVSVITLTTPLLLSRRRHRRRD